MQAQVLDMDDLDCVTGGDLVHGALIGAGVGLAFGVAIVALPAVAAIATGATIVGLATGQAAAAVAATTLSGAVVGAVVGHMGSFSNDDHSRPRGVESVIMQW